MAGSPAFTLVELLVVVATLALLSALLIPTMAGAKADNWRAQCQSRMKRLGMGMSLFAADRNNTLPPAGCLAGTWQLAWDSFIQSYIGGTGSEYCPADVFPSQGSGNWQVTYTRKSYSMVAVGPTWNVDWQVPQSGGKYILPRIKEGVGIYWKVDLPAPDWSCPGYRTEVIVDPAKTLLLVENPANCNKVGSSWPCIVIAPFGTNPQELNQIDPRAVPVSGAAYNINYGAFTYRLHGNRFNYLFHDGHVGPFTIEQTVGLGTTNSPKGMWTVAAGD